MLKEQVIQNLRNVYDPEMPSVSVYDLGLIYGLEVDEEARTVHVVHTLTSPVCPFADEICEGIYRAAKVDDQTDVTVELTFEPMFTIEMVPEDTRMVMGWY